MSLMKRPYFVFGVYVLVTIVASLQKAIHSVPNNFLIFKYSFLNFVHQIDLYSLHPEQHFDYYKYSPAFAILMAPFSYLPTLMGAILWNLINVVVLLYGVKSLDLDPKKTSFFLWFCVFEFLTSIQNFQSNVLMAGLMILSVSAINKARPFLSGVLASLLFYIKIFGAGVLALIIVDKNKIRMFLGFVLTFLVLGLVLPILISSYDYTISMYSSWLKLLLWDFDASHGYSVIAVVNKLFTAPKIWIQIFGTLILLAPLVYAWIKQRSIDIKIALSSIMVWSVIFNHKAESPTFIIAVVGVAVWYFTSQGSLVDRIILAMVFVFTTLSVTEFFPKYIIRVLGGIELVKTVPCILAWIKINYDEWSILLSSKDHQSYR